MRIRDGVRLVGLTLFAVVLALVFLNIYGFYKMRADREQLEGVYEANSVVLDLNVLAAEMQLRRSERVRRQFDKSIELLKENLRQLTFDSADNSQILARMSRHTDRLENTFKALETTLENPKFTDEARTRALRVLTQSFLASTTALASLSDRLTARHIEKIENVETYLLMLNVASALILSVLLVLIYILFHRKMMLPILNLRERIEGIADIKASRSEMFRSRQNEIQDIEAEFDRRIATLRATETKKDQYAEELQRSNQELEQFAYVASHDLRAPLKGIKMTAEWIAEDLAGQMTDDTRQNLKLLQSRAVRLEQLLNALLQYSRVQTKSHDRELTDVNTVISDVQVMLSIPEGVSVEVVGTLPKVLAVRVQLMQVFQNLIDNAIKHHDRESGFVTINAKENGAFWVFRVTDDGPGIPVEYHEKVLQIFQTLTRRDEKEASGMGLATVKKIIEQHGGELTIDSPLNGRGCAMQFTWPKSEG